MFVIFWNTRKVNESEWQRKESVGYVDMKIMLMYLLAACAEQILAWN